MLEAMIDSGGSDRGRQAEKLLEHIYSREAVIPPAYWAVRSCLGRPDEEERLSFCGAVLVHVRGRLEEPERTCNSPELAAVLEERPTRPGRELVGLLRQDGLLAPSILLVLLLLATAGVVLEAVLFRGLFDLGRELGLAGQRLGAITALVGFLVILLLLEIPLVSKSAPLRAERWNSACGLRS